MNSDTFDLINYFVSPATFILAQTHCHLPASHEMCVQDPCIAALHVLTALIVLGCVHSVCLRFAVGVGLSGVCMFGVLTVMFILVLNCGVL